MQSNALQQKLLKRLQTRLLRSSISCASQWAEKYRIMGAPFPGPWTFKYHPWTKEMHDSKSELNIGQKSAQAGYTETALNIVFYSIDVLEHDCLYVLPNKTPDATDFSASRFNSALELSPHIAKMFSDVDNVGHKRAGSANLYIRGSQARQGLKSIPTPKIFLDELDEFNQENIELALQRSTGQLSEDRLTWMLSTPTVEKFGINKYYLDSSAEHFFFKCPCCSKSIELTFPECLEITATEITDPRIVNSYIKCPSCKQRIVQATDPNLYREEKAHIMKNGVWVPSHQQRASRGFHVNQLYSCTVTPQDLAVAYLKSLKDPSAEQEFYNSRLGLPHVVKGARVTDTDINNCISDYVMRDQAEGFVTMGVDVGKVLHVVVTRWQIHKSPNEDINSTSRPIVTNVFKVENFEDLDAFMVQFNVSCCVIDANPETRLAKQFVHHWPRRAYMCYYNSQINGKEIALKEDDQTVSVNRTSWLDQTLHRFMNQKISLPVDIPTEYKEHLKAQVKWYDMDKAGNPIARYRTVGENDHYGHAQNYAEIALPIGISIGASQSMGRVL